MPPSFLRRFRARCARETLLRRRALARQGVPVPRSWLSALAADPSSGSCPPLASRPLPSLPLLPVLLHVPRDVAASHESIFFTFLGLQRFLF